MSTLPRTKSLGRADSRSHTLNLRRDRHKRPSSLCESSWNKVDLSSPQDRLRRTPSQANNLSTTVPTSLVPRNLGGRHTPTKSSLRHSRMAVMQRYHPKVVRKPRKKSVRIPSGLGRISLLVICTQIVVGIVGLLLALWLRNWAVSLEFRELPHYSGALVCSSGVLAAFLKSCFTKVGKCIGNLFKILVSLLLMASVVSCLCVCVFATLHLVNLAPMECRSRTELVVQEHLEKNASYNNLENYPVEKRKPTQNPYKGSSLRITSSRNSVKNLDLDYGVEADNQQLYEGSGSGMNPYYDDESSSGGLEVDETLEVDSEILDDFNNIRIDHDIRVNVTMCSCETRKKGWRFVLSYPNLSCNEVKNILPIFFVASCVVTVVGGVLSSILIYILYVSRQYPFCGSNNGPNRTQLSNVSNSETRPFIFKSSFNSTNGRTTSTGGVTTPSNNTSLVAQQFSNR